MLLERERELEAIERALDRLAEGAGSLVLIEGPAGIGKTEVLKAALALAREREFLVRAARGGELEREMPFGIARQLFEPVLERASETERSTLLAGSAELALMALGGADHGHTGSAGDPFAPVHGLYWLVMNLAERAPAVLAIDDIHWSDVQTLRFLDYLGRRLADTPVLVIASARSGELDEPEELEPLRLEAEAIHPAPLSPAAIERLIAAQFSRPTAEFAGACAKATAGNPFLLAEVLRTVRADAIDPGQAAAQAVETLGPGSVARYVLTRLGRFGEEAISLARAIAVLGGSPQLRHTAELSGLDQNRASELCDRLRDAEILAPGRPIDFVHPLVRASVYHELPEEMRSASHRRAAELLSEDGASPSEIAAHLIACSPERDQSVVSRLGRATTEALASGAPDAAARYLERALAEPPEDEATVLFELGRARMMMRDPRAVSDLYRVLELSDAPDQTARAVVALMQILAFAGQWDAVHALTDSALPALERHSPELATMVEAVFAAASVYDARHCEAFNRRRDHLRGLAEGDSVGALALRALLAYIAVQRGEEVAEVVPWVEAALEGGRLIGDPDAVGWAVPQAICALVGIDELERAEAVAEATLTQGQQFGVVLAILAGFAHRAMVNSRRGDLAAAAIDLRSSVELAQERAMPLALCMVVQYCRETIEERTELQDVTTLVETLELPPDFLSTGAGSSLIEVRGRLRLVRGEREAGIEDLRRAGKTFRTLQVGPTVSPWRTVLALALPPSHIGEANELIEEETLLALRTGLARPIGVVRRAAGQLMGGDDGLALLRESVSLLSESKARYEYARSLIELGAALRRSNRRGEGRERLTTGMELAYHCGAERLVERAREELAAAGSRPRRVVRTGVESLTASELRTAKLAAEGLSNLEIAQRLFVSRKTVEKHLSNAYGKLAISSREELPGALQEPTLP